MKQKFKYIVGIIISSVLFQLFWTIARLEEENSLIHNLITKLHDK